MKPRLMYSETISRSPLLTVIEESGVPSCMRFLSPDPSSHGNNSSAGNQLPANSNAVPGKKQAAAKKVAPAKGGAKANAKDAKGGAAVSKNSAKNAAEATKAVAMDGKVEDKAPPPEQQPPPPPPPPDEGMGLATVATEATEPGTEAEGADSIAAVAEKPVPESETNVGDANDAKACPASKDPTKGAEATPQKAAAKDAKSKCADKAAKGGKKVGGNPAAPSKANLQGKKVMKDAGKNLQNTKKTSAAVSKDAKKEAANAVKETEIDAKNPANAKDLADAKEPEAPEPSIKIAAEDTAEPANEEAAAAKKDAEKDTEKAPEKSTKMTKDAKLSTKYSKIKTVAPAKNAKEGKNSKNSKAVGKNADKKVSKTGAKNSAKNLSAVPENAEAVDEAPAEVAITTSNAHVALMNSSETETFDAASSDSVEPIVAASRRLAARQATGESTDVGHFTNPADAALAAAVGPPVDGMGEKAAPLTVASLESPQSTASRRHQPEPLEEPVWETEPSSALDDSKQLVATGFSSTTEQTSQEVEVEEVVEEVEEETLSADSTSLDPNDASAQVSQDSTTETATSEALEDTASQSVESLGEQRKQAAEDRERLERIKAEAVAAVRKFFAKKRSSTVVTDISADSKTAQLSASTPVSVQQTQQHQSKSLESSSCPMHVQISEKALQLFELLETAFHQRRKLRQRQRQEQRQRQRQRSSPTTTTVQNSANSSVATSADGSLRVRRRHQDRRRRGRRHCEDDSQADEEASRSAASATLSEAVIQEVEFEEATEEDDEFEVDVAPNKSAAKAPNASLAPSKPTKRSGNQR